MVDKQKNQDTKSLIPIYYWIHEYLLKPTEDVQS